MTQYFFLCASFTYNTDTRFFFDLVRLNSAFALGTHGTRATIQAYSNPTHQAWDYFIHPKWLNLKYHLPPAEAKELEPFQPSSLRDPTSLLSDLNSITGLSSNDHLVIYITNHGSDAGICLNSETYLGPQQIEQTLLRILDQGASVLLLVSACSAKVLLRTFMRNHLLGIRKKRCTIFFDDRCTDSIYHVDAQDHIGTEFCHVFLTLLGKLKASSNPNPSLREFYLGYPRKFIAYFGSNGDDKLSSFLGANIGQYTSELTKLPSSKLEIFSTSSSNSPATYLRSMISPKLMMLITRLLGHTPSDDEIGLEFEDRDFAVYYPKVVERCMLLIEKRFIIVGMFPAPNAVNCLVDIPMETIQQTIQKVEKETCLVSSNIK